MINNLINHLRVKHINMIYYYVQMKIIEKKSLKLKYILINQMMIDDLTKSLKAIKL